ncbi:MAG TPA: RsmB/NOP family class I SAM-dependent RNA methyltransferase [Bacteroidia bacterium]|nr:RsmB/NOP family class I SAM-dependent RNA methyltransferase [Bacteroidia bacterium]HNU34205.1 RsmB/NOP family class I SAM-dependent RNA methyltransferase [Bacteroidia bacterium]
MSKTSRLFIFKHIIQILQNYNGSVPLHLFLKNYFKGNKNLGSNDRRGIRSSVYNFFRLTNVLGNISLEAKINVSDFLLSDNINQSTVDFLKEKFNFNELKSIDNEIYARAQKLKHIGINVDLANLFPFKNELSEGVDRTQLNNSILKQPYVWVRVRKDFLKQFIAEIETRNLTFELSDNEFSFSFNPSANLTDLDCYKKGYFEIQDLSSQQTINVLNNIKYEDVWWDCCAGSGGKSLLIKEKFPETRLIISDTRKSILENAEARLKKAGAVNFSINECDLQKENPSFLKSKVDGIIADVPCSGSGTWARTPEALTYFNKTKMEELAELQLQIINKAFECLKVGGLLLYITCSVFKRENEGVINDFLKNSSALVIEKKIIEGYTKGADTMFVCLLKKKS